MKNTEKTAVEQAGEDLFKFAFDREDVKILMGRLPEKAPTIRNTVEYELQILKIISIGWSISYFLENYPYKNQITESYWKAVHELSTSLSSSTELMIGKDINYFQIIKDRLDLYVNAMKKRPDVTEPEIIIGPEFAGICKDEDDVFTVMTGSRMFTAALASVKEYFISIKLI